MTLCGLLLLILERDSSVSDAWWKQGVLHGMSDRTPRKALPSDAELLRSVRAMQRCQGLLETVCGRKRYLQGAFTRSFDWFILFSLLGKRLN